MPEDDFNRQTYNTRRMFAVLGFAAGALLSLGTIAVLLIMWLLGNPIPDDLKTMAQLATGYIFGTLQSFAKDFGSTS